MAGRRLLSEGHDHHLPHAPRAVYLRGWKAVLVFGVSLRTAGRRRRKYSDCWFEYQDDASGMQRSVVMRRCEANAVKRRYARRGTEDAKRAPQTACENKERRRACSRRWRTTAGNCLAKLLTRVFSAGGRALTSTREGRENEPPFRYADFRYADFGLKSWRAAKGCACGKPASVTHTTYYSSNARPLQPPREELPCPGNVPNQHCRTRALSPGGRRIFFLPG